MLHTHRHSLKQLWSSHQLPVDTHYSMIMRASFEMPNQIRLHPRARNKMSIVSVSKPWDDLLEFLVAGEALEDFGEKLIFTCL